LIFNLHRLPFPASLPSFARSGSPPLRVGWKSGVFYE
jgi:hypothetical protein